MPVISGFFDSVNKDRVYNAEFLALFHGGLVSNGVYPNPSNNLQVSEREKMTTVVKVGKAWINGHFVISTDDFVIQHDMADGGLSRIDRVVLQLDTAGRMIDIVVKKGPFSSNPVAPVVLRNADFYELVLADVRIGAGQVQILQSNITDQRLNNALCGIVHGYIDQVDTTAIFNQYQSWFNEYSVLKADEFETWTEEQKTSFELWRDMEEVLFSTWSTEQKAAFDAWFATVKDILDTNVAGNLFNRLEDHKAASMPHQYTDTTTMTRYNWGMGAENGVAFLLIEEDV